MLTISENAAAAIRDLLDNMELGEEAGLRISAELDENQQPGLHIALAEAPEEEDVTVSEHGVNVFLDPAAADALDDKVLDAELHGDHAHFGISDQE
jgi:Fe-S cluster assembly iron-binding protein IscA